VVFKKLGTTFALVGSTANAYFSLFSPFSDKFPKM